LGANFSGLVAMLLSEHPELKTKAESKNNRMIRRERYCEDCDCIDASSVVNEKADPQKTLMLEALSKRTETCEQGT